MIQNLELSAWTHLGKVKEQNEDYVWIPQTELRIPPQGSIPAGIVADGCGGRPAALEAATRTGEAIQAISGIQAAGPGGLGWAQQVRDLCHQAHRDLLEIGRQDPDKSGMGTTLTALASHQGQLWLIHAGDSQCLRLRDGELTRESRMDMDPTRGRYGKLLNAFGRNQASFYVEVKSLAAEPGDLFLLCSDGLTDMTSPEDIQATLRRDDLLTREKTESLGSQALQNGGEDNIGIVLAKVLN